MARVPQWLVADPGCPPSPDSLGVRGRLCPGSGRDPRAHLYPQVWVRERHGCDLVPASLDVFVLLHLF